MRKLTPRQEAFAMAYVETGNASEAYRRAYPRSRKWKPEAVKVRASELLKRGNVSVTVEALRAEARERHAITVDRLTQDAMTAYEVAKAANNPSAMVRALEFLAKLHGLFVDRHEIGVSGGPKIVAFEVVPVTQEADAEGYEH